MPVAQQYETDDQILSSFLTGGGRGRQAASQKAASRDAELQQRAITPSNGPAVPQGPSA